MNKTSLQIQTEGMVWSYSRLKTFEDCPYRWYLRYILLPNADRREQFFANYGSFFHRLLADFYSGQKTLDEIRFQYLTTFKQEVKGFAPSEKIYINYFESGLERLKTLEKSGNTVREVETKVDFQIGGFPFIGYVDLIEETPTGDLLLIDHKSKTMKPRSTRKKPTKTDGELDAYLRQLYLYATPISQKYGAYPKQLGFHCYRQQNMIMEDFDFQKLHEAEDWVERVVDNIQSIQDSQEFTPKPEYFKCKHLCEMQEYCKHRM